MSKEILTELKEIKNCLKKLCKEIGAKPLRDYYVDVKKDREDQEVQEDQEDQEVWKLVNALYHADKKEFMISDCISGSIR